MTEGLAWFCLQNLPSGPQFQACPPQSEQQHSDALQSKAFSTPFRLWRTFKHSSKASLRGAPGLPSASYMPLTCHTGQPCAGNYPLLQFLPRPTPASFCTPRVPVLMPRHPQQAFTCVLAQPGRAAAPLHLCLGAQHAVPNT